MFKPYQQLYQCLSDRLIAITLLLGLVLPCYTIPAYAESGNGYNISIINSHEGDYYRSFIDRFKQTTLAIAGDKGIDLRIDEHKTANDSRSTGNVDFYVSVGADAAIKLLQAGHDKPMLHTLLPEQTYTRIRNQYPAGNAPHYPVYIDFPANDFLHLISAALPDKKKVGIILGPDSRQYLSALNKSAGELGLELAIEIIETENDLIPALKNLQGRMQVFLALPDKQVHNRRTAKTILLSTYRYNIPVVAYSQAYVKAGALISMYAKPQDMADQAAEVLFHHLEKSAFGSCIGYPDRVSVDTNTSVSRLLARDMADARDIEHAMRANQSRCVP